MYFCAEHFLSHPNHCHTDMQLIPLGLIHSSSDAIRKARESFLIDLASTLEPQGMNRRDDRKTCNLTKPLIDLASTLEPQGMNRRDES